MRMPVATLLLITTAVPVWSDGAFMGAEVLESLSRRAAGETAVASTEQKGIIIELPQDREALLLQTTYHGPADKFAWIIPVPGKPAKDDVFLASPEFIDELLDNTRPEVDTNISAIHGPSKQRMMEAAEGVPPGAPIITPTVTVHERLQLGSYDVAVLSATGVQVLTDWLQGNGFRVPPNSNDVLGYYVKKKWYFVALKILPEIVQQQSVMKDIAPIGIRFSTEELVYPLYISRASSRQKTALLLVVLSNNPVKCDQLPEVSLPLGKTFRKRTSYATIRRQAVDQDPPHAVCEFRGPWGMPYLDLYYAKDAWGGREGSRWSPANLWTTRLWTLLDLDELEDLTFSPSTDKHTLKLTILRKGEIYRPFLERVKSSALYYPLLWTLSAVGIFLLAAWRLTSGLTVRAGRLTTAFVLAVGVSIVASPFGLWSVIVLAVVGPLLLLYSLRRDNIAPDDLQAVGSRGHIIRGVLLAAGIGMFWCMAGIVAEAGHGGPWGYGFGEWLTRLWDGDLSTGTTLLTGAAELVWILLVIDLLRRGLKGAGKKAGLVAAIAVLLIGLGSAWMFKYHFLRYTVWSDFFSSTGIEIQSYVKAQHVAGLLTLICSLLGFAALAVLLAFLAVAGFISVSARLSAQPLAHTMIVLIVGRAIVSVIGIAVANAGTPGVLASGLNELDTALKQLDDRLVKFREAYGCYPAKLGDLAATTAPKEGVDSSGNRVPIAANAKLHVAAGAPLPIDPLTGRRDTWVYEPTGSPMVDSGGYEITILTKDVAPTEVSAAWKGPTPPLSERSRQQKPRYYWLSNRPVLLPFIERGGTIFTRERLARKGDTLRRFIPARQGYRLILADVAAHAQFVSSPREGCDGIALAPDGLGLIYACNAEHGATLFVATITGTHLDRHFLLKRPWPVEVRDIAWHPSEKKWLILAQDPQGDPQTQMYIVTDDGVPQPIGERGNLLTARFTPKGDGIVAIESPKPLTHSEGTPSKAGILWRFSPSGERLIRVADRVRPRPFLVSKDGLLAVVGKEDRDVALLHMDSRGAEHSIRLPVARSIVTDAWLGADELAVALLLSRYPVESGVQPLGEVWAYSFASDKWRIMARWNVRSTRSLERDREVKIIGRDRPTGAYVLAAQEDDSLSVYAVRSEAPRLELLVSPSQAKFGQPIEVDIAGKQRTVAVEGLYDASAFKVGDLIATRTGDPRPYSAVPVGLREADSLVVGRKRIPLTKVPVIGHSGTECYAKLKLK